MPALIATAFSARITWIGYVPRGTEGIRSTPLRRLDLGWEGIPGDRHSGFTRASCARVTQQHAKGTEIRNVRQISIVSAEEMARVAEEMGLPRLEPEWLGASMVVEGIDDFSHLPPSSRLQAEAGATLTVDMQNRPCTLPAREIERDAEGFGKAFRAAAAGRRGITASVERPGPLAVGDVLKLHVPDQRDWAHIGAARGA